METRRKPGPRRAKASWPLGWVIALGAVACTEPTSTLDGTLEVLVDTDIEVPARLDRVELWVNQGLRRTFGPGEDLQFPLREVIGAAELGESSVRIEAIGLLGSEQVVSRSARTEILSGRALRLDLFLSQDCWRVRGCPLGQTCVPGPQCVSEDVDPNTLPDANGAGVDAGLPPAAARPRGSSVSPRWGAGVQTSSQYRLELSVGGPVPLTTGESANYRVRWAPEALTPLRSTEDGR